MTQFPLGDMSTFFQNARQTTAIKTDLQRLAKELSSGVHADLTEHLKGDTTKLAGLDSEISRIDAYDVTSKDVQRTLALQQDALNSLNTLRDKLSSQFLVVSGGSTEVIVVEGGAAGRAAFDTAVGRLNGSVAERAQFSGRAVNSAALASADDMMADIVTAIGGATTLGAISAALDTWFDDPAGGFATMGYLGDTGPAPERQISEADRVTLEARADDAALRDLLKGFAMAAVVQEIGTLPQATRSDLLREAGVQLHANAADLVKLTGRLGATEARVEDVRAMSAAKRTSFAIARNDLVAADPYETAGKLDAVQTQLELQFAMTARLSGLSLVNYI